MELLAAADHIQEKPLTVALVEAVEPMAQLAEPRVQEPQAKETREATRRPPEDQAAVAQVPSGQTP
jgi:hypothetical protein